MTWIETRKFYASLDWTKQDCVLARENGITVWGIQRARKRYGFPESKLKWAHPKRDPKFRKALIKKWLTWDWSIYDAELARQKGLSWERIRQIRLIVEDLK